VQAIGLACVLLAILYFFLPATALHQTIFFVGLFILLLVLVSWRVVYQYICHNRLFNEKIVLVGDGSLASLITKEISENLDSGYSVAAVFSNPGNTGLARRIGVEEYNSYDRICDVAWAKGANKIVVSLEERRGRYPTRALLDCRMQGMRVLEGISFYEMLSGKILATQTPPSWLIFSEGFRRHQLVLLSKRGLDILFASLGLVLSLPLIAIIALLIKATSFGPVFFRQSRTGKYEKPFQVVKFRTMREDAESSSGAVWASEEDPRITSVGRVLRKFRLDEIPQFWNVLKGEMSFVGPRPERPEFVEQLKKQLPYYGERHTVAPGITGWAQVNYGYGASEEDALRKLEYDLFYIKNLSLIFDLYIVLKTVKAVLIGGGAR
jgi:sugar transferase (PEP-CTERM system associated)